MRPNRRTPSTVSPSRWSNSTADPTTSIIRGTSETRMPACLALRMSASVASELAVGTMITRPMSWLRTSSSNAPTTPSAEPGPSTSEAITSAFTCPLSSLSATASIEPRSPTIRQRSGTDTRPANARAAPRSTTSRRNVTVRTPTTSRASSTTGVQPACSEPQHERVDRGELQQARDLVERRLLEHEVVALVEAADLRDEDHHRDRGERGRAGRSRSRRRRGSRSRRAWP